MTFQVRLKNQRNPEVEVEVTVHSSYDAARVVGDEAKRQMNLPAAWDVASIVRLS